MERDLRATGGSLTPELLEEFRRIYAEEFDEQLSDREALNKATQLVSLFRAIYRPIPTVKESVYKGLQQWYNDNERP